MLHKGKHVISGYSDEQVFAMDRAELDALPDGVITLDRTGRIVNYNRAEADLARRSQAETIGLNFFSDVAPCTAVQEFKGRFDTFAAGEGAAVDRFDFVFRFAWGKQDVSVTMIRKGWSPDIALLVARRTVTG